MFGSRNKLIKYLQILINYYKTLRNLQLLEDGIKTNPNEDKGNSELLYSVMRCIRDMNKYDKIVDPLQKSMRDNINCLRFFEYEMDENYLDQIDAAFNVWNDTKSEHLK